MSTPNKRKRKVKATIRKDKHGKFILINGKKFRIGDKVSPINLSSFLLDQAKKQTLSDLLPSQIQQSIPPPMSTITPIQSSIDSLENITSTEENIKQAIVNKKEGRGAFDDKGMSNLEIDHVLQKYPEYLGCISHDEIPKILRDVKPQSRGGFVINTDPHNKPGQHWQALYFDARPNGESEIDWYDSYADPIDKKLLHDIKLISNRLNAKTYLKFKENKIIQQNNKSSNCGWFCCEFLIDRFRGKPWIEATKFNDVHNGEAKVEKFKTQYGYMKSFGDGDI